MPDCKLECFELKDWTQWNSLLNEKTWNHQDIRFRPEWLSCWGNSNYGKVLCLSGTVGKTNYLYPFLLNPIKDTITNGKYFDIESAYNAGGVITTQSKLTKSEYAFNHSVDKWLKKQNVICEFIRLAPELNNARIRNAEYFQVRKDCFLNVKDREPSEIWENILNPKVRNMIRKAEKNKLRCEISLPNSATINRFESIYNESCERIGMAPYYNFPSDYYQSLCTKIPDVLFIETFHDSKPVASSIWIHFNGCLHYYLSGTRNDWTRLPCSNLFCWEAICIACKDKKTKKIHWGGGFNNSPQDKLYKFKSKYSDSESPIFIGTKILLPEIYEKITDEWDQKHPESLESHGHKLMRYKLA